MDKSRFYLYQTKHQRYYTKRYNSIYCYVWCILALPVPSKRVVIVTEKPGRATVETCLTKDAPFLTHFSKLQRRAALYKSLGFLWFLECLAANKAYTMKNSGSPFTIRFISSTDDRFLEICHMSVYYHHLSMNHRVDLGQGAIWSLVLNKPVHRVTQKLFVNIIRPRKFLNLAKYPHNKCSQP